MNIQITYEDDEHKAVMDLNTVAKIIGLNDAQVEKVIKAVKDKVMTS